MEAVTLLLSVALLITTLLFLYKFSAKRRRYVAMINKLPGPQTLPFIGNAMDVLVPRNQFIKVTNHHAKIYYPIFRSWSGPSAEIHLLTPEDIEGIINNMTHINKSWMYSFLHPWLGQGLLTSSGQKWQSHRKLITPTFHFSILEPFCDVFVEKSKILVEKLQQEVDLRGKQDFDIYPFITRCALDIICETAMGTEIRAQDEIHSEYVRAVKDISNLTMKRGLTPWLHPDWIHNLSSTGKKYKHCLQVLHGFTTKVIQERKAEKLQNSKQTTQTVNEEDAVLGKKKRMAFLDLLLEVSEGGNKLTDTEIREEVDTFLFEGHDTTTAGISWALYLIGAHPNVQEKVIAELDKIFEGSDRPITMRDLQEMKYLEQVIKETLRLYPSVPFIMRTLNGDTECGGYLLPSGCIINVHILHLHRNPEVFPNPDAFDPDHFLPERVQGRHPYAYIPFSAGPRNCIGQKFAMMEEKTVIAAVMRRFRIRSVEKMDEIVLISELILNSENGIRTVLTPR